MSLPKKMDGARWNQAHHAPNQRQKLSA